MREVLLARGARKLVEVNGRVRASERVVIVTDYKMFEFAKQVAAAAMCVGAEPVICVMEPRERDGQEPPIAIAKAMAEADVIFTPVSKSITHTKAMRAALNEGARAVLMTAHNEDILTSPSLLETDFQGQAALCGRMAALLSKAQSVHVTTEKGTDLRFSLKGRNHCNSLTGIPQPGELAPVPTIEVNVVPIEGTAEGRLVVDCCVPYLGIGLLREPIICTVEAGYITSMEGGEQAKQLVENLRSYNDKNCFNVAELGIGLNPNARPTGMMLEDEGILGTIHIGIGTSFTLGGSIVAPTHYDLLIWNPTIELDGVVIQRGQEILLPETSPIHVGDAVTK